MKVSIIIPVYFNEDNLVPLYDDIRKKVLDTAEFEYELLFVDDGSLDNSWKVLKTLSKKDKCIRLIRLSRNFGSHAAVLCGLANCTGDCAVVKAADLQEPSELLMQMVESWRKGNHVVLAVRKGRQESLGQRLFADLYYWMVRKVALHSMPKGGFDVYLLDRKVVVELVSMREKNSALTGQVLWSGFHTDVVYYTRLARQVGKSRWTVAKKVKLVMDTLFSFSTLPISVVLAVGACSFVGALIWAVIVLASKLVGSIVVSGWTTLFIFQLFSFGVIMLTLGILGEYLWRTFDASRNRPPYIIQEERKAEMKEEMKNEIEEIEGKRCTRDARVDE